MENLTEQQLCKRYLEEALEMLDDMRYNLSLFEKQRYYRFRAKINGELCFKQNKLPGSCDDALNKPSPDQF
ncbi:hypothetical protein A0256_17475 [Mucilaginibacter sp. PAMC 26640]|nr:hypothetical protein A0256_17475 [Mucilaginibacter sp. PAMC 26640]